MSVSDAPLALARFALKSRAKALSPDPWELKHPKVHHRKNIANENKKSSLSSTNA
jgi:hypothetical protein